MSDDNVISSAAGGFMAPSYHGALMPMKRGDVFHVTYPVQGRLRRWWFRRTGWSTEWTQEHEYVPITDYLPNLTATRGGIAWK